VIRRVGTLGAAARRLAPLAVAASTCACAAVEPASQVNQLGFPPGAAKWAAVSSTSADTFTVRDEVSGREVLTGKLGPAARWTPAESAVRLADLSALTRPGTYRLHVDGAPDSPPFAVAVDPYAALAAGALRADYFNRAGIALERRYAGPHARPAGHPDTRVLVHASAASASRPEGSVISSPGGWYDAGDYNKYVVNSDRALIERRIRSLSGELLADWLASPWRLSMREEDFRWGSNSIALNRALVLIQGYRLDGDRRLLDAAQSSLDYVLGRNPLGMTMVTGFGTRSPRHPHHRPSMARGDGHPVPGFLVGGPNPGQQDAQACREPYASTAPALSYLDAQCAFASNEVAINWNAPLVYVSAALATLTPPSR